MSDENKIIEEEAIDHESEPTEPSTMNTEADEEGTEEDLLAITKRESEENYDRFLRVQADFDNFRRRSRNEKDNLLKYAAQALVESLLPAIDNLERAIAAAEQEDDSLLKGVEMVYNQILQTFEQEGVVPIKAEGEFFDANYHQAVMKEENTDMESGIVLQELQRGYMLKDRVIRPSMVKVNA